MGFLTWLSPFKWYALGGVVAIVLGTFLWQETHINLLEHSLAEVTKARDTAIALRQTEHAEAEALAKTAKTKFDAQHTADLQRIKTAEDERDKAQATAAKFASQYRAADKLRNDAIAAFARGSGSAADAASAQDRADKLGAVLQESLRVVGELATDAEDAASDARLLRDSWPQ